ncbi:MAG TPA: hypothetical protein PKN02_10040, partial [Thermotogota bacterium]|nr:hypothetical protein [Thermotogota bacterium]
EGTERTQRKNARKKIKDLARTENTEGAETTEKRLKIIRGAGLQVGRFFAGASEKKDLPD